MIDNRVIKIRHVTDKKNKKAIVILYREKNTNVYTEPFRSKRLQRLMKVITDMDKAGKIHINWENFDGSVLSGDWSYIIYYP